MESIGRDHYFLPLCFHALLGDNSFGKQEDSQPLMGFIPVDLAGNPDAPELGVHEDLPVLSLADVIVYEQRCQNFLADAAVLVVVDGDQA